MPGDDLADLALLHADARERQIEEGTGDVDQRAFQGGDDPGQRTRPNLSDQPVEGPAAERLQSLRVGDGG